MIPGDVTPADIALAVLAALDAAPRPLPLRLHLAALTAQAMLREARPAQ